MLRVTRGKLTLTPERRIGPSTQAAQLRPSVDRASAMAHRCGHTPPPIRSACSVLPLASLTSLHTLGPKAPTARKARQTREFAPPQADLMSPERTAAQSSPRTRTSASSPVATVHRRKLSGAARQPQHLYRASAARGATGEDRSVRLALSARAGSDDDNTVPQPVRSYPPSLDTRAL